MSWFSLPEEVVSLASKNNLTRDEARERAEVVRDVHYRIALDLTGDDVFASESVIRFGCSGPGSETFLDLTAHGVSSIEVNGRAVSTDAFDGNRVRLSELEEENEVRIAATCRYYRTEVGMHRFVDPIDGNVYVHTHLEPFGAHRVFACFDQPDIKGTFDFTVVVPEGWEVVSNSRPAEKASGGGEGAARWTFETTARMPAYITAVCAGPYHSVRDRHRDIDLGLYCRQSLAEHLDPDELLEVTKQGFDFFEPAFGYPYAFGKYDQVFIPESNSGAMENAGCVTFNDLYIFRSRVTDAARERRAETVLHEMAHMWFGDLVTLRWWDDLWLNESFASYMGVLAEAEATRFKEAWTTFADTEKTWAYRQDQLPTTHPIVADVPDVESVHLNFDGISYAKGASVLKQLVAWVGRERFLEGLRVYCKRYEFGNASLDDFLAAVEDGSGRDLHAWSKEWLETAGVNTLRADFRVRKQQDHQVFDSFDILQDAPSDWPTLRSHHLAVGLYDATEHGLVRRRQVYLDIMGERTEVPELAGERVPDLTLLNDDDLTYAKIRLDERSLGTVVQRLGELQDSLARTLCWTACWDMTRDAEMPARHYLELVIRNIGAETRVGVVQTLLGQSSFAINLYGDPGNRNRAGQALAETSLEGLRGAEPGSDYQLVWARSFISSARSSDHLAMVGGLLDGSVAFDGLVVDTDLRWHIVRSLAAVGTVGEEAIAAENRRDPSDRGNRHAAAARAARPTAEAKAEAWRVIVEDLSQPLALLEEMMGGFQQFGQEALLEPYAQRFFDVLPDVWERRDLPEALAFGRRMYPHLIVKDETVERTDRYLARDSVPSPVRRLLLEGCEGILRALRAREADRAAGQAPVS
jgi:aminopeptidase N